MNFSCRASLQLIKYTLALYSSTSYISGFQLQRQFGNHTIHTCTALHGFHFYFVDFISIVWISSPLHWWTASWRVVSVVCNSWISKSLPFQNGISSEKANSEQKLTRGNCFSIFCNALANFTNNYMVSLFENITFHLQCSILKAELFNEAGKLLV